MAVCAGRSAMRSRRRSCPPVIATAPIANGERAPAPRPTAASPRPDSGSSAGEEQLRPYQPPTGVPKLFCTVCGSALFSGEPLSDPEVAVRLGTLDGDPGIRPQFRQFVASAAPWEPIPDDDGLERHKGTRS